MACQYCSFRENNSIHAFCIREVDEIGDQSHFFMYKLSSCVAFIVRSTGICEWAHLPTVMINVVFMCHQRNCQDNLLRLYSVLLSPLQPSK